MFAILDHPLALFLFSLLVLWVSIRLGTLAKRVRPLQEPESHDLELVTSASLTLLALIIGFSFSMAVNRYDQRKNYEEEEANAIATEYLRADLLPSVEATKLRTLLVQYLGERLSFYTTRDGNALLRVDRETAELQADMWATVQRVAVVQPTPSVALAVAGMNDVLNRQGYTQAAWWNRIPPAAWILMMALAICCGLLVGYGSRQRGALLSSALPLVISVAFFLIADIESSRYGVIRVAPANLISLSKSLHR